MRTLSFRLLVALVVAPVVALHGQGSRADSASAVAVVSQFHAALSAGDSARAVSLLASDVMVLESGAIQNRVEYLGHHLGADMKASAGSKGERIVVHVNVTGNSAIVISKTITPPSGAEGSTGSEMAELMVLAKGASGWQIRAVHWSSRRRRG